MQSCQDQCNIRLDGDENRAGLSLKPRRLAEEERAEIDFRSWHETVMPVLSPQVRYEGLNGPSSVAVSGQRLAQLQHWGGKCCAC
jgi:hypothetical protein